MVKNQFPALISEQLWEDAHKALSSRKRESKSGAENIFAGLIKCEKCGYVLGIANAHGRDNFFVCNTYKKKGPEYCSAHYILYDELYSAVLKDVRKIIELVHKDRDTCVQRIAKKLGMTDKSRIQYAETEKAAIEQRLSEADRRFDLLYEDRLNGTIPESKFKDIIGRWQADQAELQSRLENLQKQISDVQDVEADTRRFADLVDQLSQVDELDAELLYRLIDKIIIGDRSRENGRVKQKITIQYKFVGSL